MINKSALHAILTRHPQMDDPLAFGHRIPQRVHMGHRRAAARVRTSRRPGSPSSVIPPGRSRPPAVPRPARLVTGSPISCWASATASQMRRQVLNLCRADHSRNISSLALRVARGWCRCRRGWRTSSEGYETPGLGGFHVRWANRPLPERLVDGFTSEHGGDEQHRAPTVAATMGSSSDMPPPGCRTGRHSHFRRPCQRCP